MWLSEQRRKIGRDERTAEVGVVTLQGEQTGVYLSGERRDLPILGPGGYCWRPAAGEQVLVLKAGEDGEQPWVAGTACEMAAELEPGDVGIFAGGAAVVLQRNGTVDLRGTVMLNGESLEALIHAKAKEGS